MFKTDVLMIPILDIDKGASAADNQSEISKELNWQCYAK